MAKFLVTSGLEATRLYYKNRPHGYLDRMKRYLDVIQEIDPNNYDAHLGRAAYLFLRDHDIDGAKREIRKARNRNERNAAWQYSEAFLAAYERKLEEAHKIYRRAFRGSVLEETPLDVEVFISDVLESEPDKIQLWYCLGMINYFYKKDFASARRDFSRFIEEASRQDKFSVSVQYARRYLQEIQ